MDASFAHVHAESLLQARKNGNPVTAPSITEPQLTVKDGFDIQRIQIEARIAGGEKIAGWKIGALSAASRALGMTEPFLGPIFESETFVSGTELDRSRYIAPGAEPEIAFKIGSRLRGLGISPNDLSASIDGAVAALELVDCRCIDWRIKAADIPADCGLTAGAIVSDKMSTLSDLALEQEEMSWFANDELVATATGAEVGGSPLNMIPWLTAKLADWGMALEAGDIVLAGALASHVKPAHGETLRAEFSNLGSVSVTFV